ncbi:uncharacterized protein N7459_001390 [Penicillium hispanicum]|uniref:uncharacterized protein n=1 Tax=Penicillium hispanicum TaxID=1080232 RepID=UPI002541FA60|nr:uncharacterized protein N7459_001390 [Penicillium hispanicum]KAJ5595182.1 hypothetical protein N7459_001390 [Penicillium hispanicum]
MPPTTIQQKAFVKLKELSIWLSKTNEFKEEKENLFRCVDKDRHAKVDPLLEELGFKVEVGYGYSLWRVMGRSAFESTRKDYQSLYFPLSIQSESDSTKVQAVGEALRPGTYISFTSRLTLHSRLDC